MLHQSQELTRRLSLTLFVVLTVSLVVSLFFKSRWLWADEVLSYLLISDPSITHMNDAVVSGMDANPPLFPNLYWLIGHTISLDPLFLRAVSVVIFAVTIALFYRHTTGLIGTPVTNFVLITAIVAFTYLNLTLSTQIRSYSTFLLIGFNYFVVLQRLITNPDQAKLLIAHCVLGLLLVLTHNFGLFYVAASGAFFTVLWAWSRQRQYGWVLAAHGLVGLVWLLSWYPNFVVQAEAGKPHSWIPVPTFRSFFSTVGELAPTVSATLEGHPRLLFLPILRFGLVVGLFAYLALPRLKAGFRAIKDDRAFGFFLLSGWLYLTTIGIALLVSLVHTSVFLSRYLWPSHLLLIYQLVFAWHVLRKRWSIRVPAPAVSVRLLPIYGLLLGGFLFYQSRKGVIFTDHILQHLPQLDKRYPVFFESAHYFLPIWLQDKTANARYVLDWKTAVREGNKLNASVDHKVLESVWEKYHVTDILPPQRFNRTAVPHFYVIDESSRYQIEEFIRKGRVRVVRQLPISLPGHRILECTF